MLKLEGFLAMGTLKLTKHGTLIMADHVPLESVDVSKGLAAHLAGLEKRIGYLLNRRSRVSSILRSADFKRQSFLSPSILSNFFTRNFFGDLRSICQLFDRGGQT